MAGNDKLYACKRNNCDKKFSHKSNRSRHQKICTKGEEVLKVIPFECNNLWCHSTFKRSYNYRRHLSTCRPKTQTQHVCLEPGCERTFHKLSKLLRHQLIHARPTYTAPPRIAAATTTLRYQQNQQKMLEQQVIPHKNHQHTEQQQQTTIKQKPQKTQEMQDQGGAEHANQQQQPEQLYQLCWHLWHALK